MGNMKHREIDPIELLTTNRFDVIIKYLYAKSYLNNYKSNYYLDMYREHLRLWNNFIEYDNKNKRGFEFFKNTFENLIDDININGFNQNESVIPVMNKNILNGSHRLASALISNKNVFTTPGLNGRDGQLDCGWRFFKGLGFSESYSDRVALEYALLKKNTHVITIFPKAVASGKLDQLDKIINDGSRVFYSKRIKLNKNGLFNLIRELYLDEPWVGKYPKYDGYLGKTQYCYADDDTIIYLCEFNSLNDCVKIKEKIRNLYNINKHSVHINDTHEETMRISKTVFNQNSVNFLNNNKSVTLDGSLNISEVKYLNNFETYLGEYKRLLTKTYPLEENYCVTSSSVLAIYGLRDVTDLDYIHSIDTKIESNNIHSHNNHGEKLYETHYDDIIHNPDNHFYSRGIKFVSLDLIKKFKLKRSETKDIVDISLIKNII
jgi:hypothetical protein